jgi:hypothetical protein
MTTSLENELFFLTARKLELPRVLLLQSEFVLIFRHDCSSSTICVEPFKQACNVETSDSGARECSSDKFNVIRISALKFEHDHTHNITMGTSEECFEIHQQAWGLQRAAFFFAP